MLIRDSYQHDVLTDHLGHDIDIGLSDEEVTVSCEDCQDILFVIQHTACERCDNPSRKLDDCKACGQKFCETCLPPELISKFGNASCFCHKLTEEQTQEALASSKT